MAVGEDGERAAAAAGPQPVSSRVRLGPAGFGLEREPQAAFLRQEPYLVQRTAFWKQSHESGTGGFRRKADERGIGSDERPAEDTFRPARQVVAFECGQKGFVDLCRSGNRLQRDAAALPFTSKTGAEGLSLGHISSARSRIGRISSTITTKIRVPSI